MFDSVLNAYISEVDNKDNNLFYVVLVLLLLTLHKIEHISGSVLEVFSMNVKWKVIKIYSN